MWYHCGRINMYVCFLEKLHPRAPELPLDNEKEGPEFIKIINTDAHLVNRPVKSRYGFPNNFIEKELGLISTIRN
jgi:hypothetical protein